MKKTYISPEIKTCEIGTATVIAQSLTFSSQYEIVDNEDIGVKSQGSTTSGVWDDEW